MEKYEASNSEIARIFFWDQRTDLFIDDIDENEDQPVFQGLAIENTEPVFTEMLYNQHETINALKEKIEKSSYYYADKVLSDRLNISFIEIEFNELVRAIISSQQITGIRLKKDGLIYTATGNDPNFIVANPLPEPEIKALAIVLKVPGETISQFFLQWKWIPGFLRR